jgi:hypothetical protein
MNRHCKTLSIALTAAAALATGGCESSSSSPAAQSTAAPASSVMPDMPVMAGVADKECSHVIMLDTPVYSGPPSQGMPPVGVVKAGTKVLSMVPGAQYTQCQIAGGKTVYIKTTMLQPYHSIN